MSDIRVVIVGKIDKADWEHNFAIVDAIVDAFGGKLDASQKAAANGVASLNSDSKVIQIALNSERLNNKTEADFANLFIQFSSKGAANGVAELDATGKLKAAQVPESISSGLNYQGSWDADANTPTMDSADGSNKGYFFVVAVSGETNIDGINTWAEGDWIISNGSSWERIPALSAPVISVAGKTGTIVLEIADIDGLAGALTLKADIGAESVSSVLTDLNEIISQGNYNLNNIESVANRPDTAIGEAFLSVLKYGSSKTQVLTTINNGNMYNRVFSGVWSAWRLLN